jgi:ferrochelatase
LYEAASSVPNAPRLDKLRVPYNHPGFIEAMRDRVAEALKTLPLAKRKHALVLFSAHSLPLAMARGCAYEAQLAESCRLVAEALEHERWRLVYQSNNASYGREPWLGPDIRDALRDADAEGVRAVVVAPIGFVCDHMEVIMDLDVDAAAVARELELKMARAGTVGTHPAYVAMVRELIVERLSVEAPRRALGSLGPSHDRCPADCCLPGRPGPLKPALCGVDDPSPEPS